MSMEVYENTLRLLSVYKDIELSEQQLERGQVKEARSALAKMRTKQEIPFRVENPVPNADTIRAIEDTKDGINLSRGFTSVSELMEDLDADD